MSEKIETFEIAETLEDSQQAIDPEIGEIISTEHAGELMIYRSDCKEIIAKVIESFEAGVDYGRSAGKKDSLWIPGADKFCFAFNIKPEWVKDTEVLEMLSGLQKIIAFKCILSDRKTKTVLGEGRGAAQIGEGENCNTINGAIKMAEIRAKKDAVLNLFPIRDRFTQDLVEEDEKGQKKSTVTVQDGKVQVL